MSLIEEINKLHVSLKSFLVGLVFIMPFWYLDIYFFANPFFDSSPFYIPIVVAFCISAVCYLPLYFLGMLVFSVTMPFNPTRTIATPTVDTYLTVLVSIFTLGFLTYYGWTHKLTFMKLVDKTMWVIGCEFGVLLLISGYRLISWMKTQAKNRKEEKK